ncbi:MAG: NepR family anti-sigma factor [Cereibacter changlensis]|uniref:Transcriptional regulator n=2 Tax=Cereibacter changlensis TaxID=402884 RepID=A0A2T4JPE9_9RHOB|nr:NepR family anti-sigma factor [Cereibacter changlensis]PTE19761.1 transcriptional regulator [Cereibacter changlensis JA139]
MAKRDKSGMQHQIDENLKRVYEEALVQELPDRFTQLLEQLRQKEEKK